MNKRVLLGMTLMASLAFYSCTKEIVIVQEGGEGGIETPTAQDGQVLTLQVANSGDGLTTRAGRPLLSSQAKQDINTIVLYVVDGSNKVVLKKTIGPDEWANALDYSNTSAHGKQLQITFRKSDKQDLAGDADGITYDIYAVGYKESSNYATTFGVSGAPTTTSDNPTVTFTETNFATTLSSNNNPADEIFAGKVAVKVVTKADGTSYIVAGNAEDVNNKVVPALVLNRQVAGVTGYFTNLPAKVGTQIPAKIRLVASGKSNKVHFTSMVSGETDGTTTAAATNVVNGSASSLTAENLPYWNSSKKGYKVYEIGLSEFFPQMNDSDGPKTFDQLDLDGDGFVGYKDAQYYVYGKVPSSTSDWDTACKGNVDSENMESSYNEGKTKPLSEFWKNANKNQTLVAGSVFAGEFIIPFLQVSGTNTFELQLLDEHDNILKTWNVQVPTKVTGGSAENNIAAGITATWADDTDLIYNIYRNHLYSLGMKTNDIEDGGEPGTTDPDPKPEPDPDPNPEDKPEDLSKGQDLLINVNDNWEIIHNMVID